MEQCPRCYNSEIDEKDNYCKICGLNLKEVTAAGTADILEEHLQLIEVRMRRIERRVTDPIERQQLLAALEAQRCSLQSFQQQQE